MKQKTDELGAEWDDGEEATTVYQEGMLEEARAALTKMAAEDRAGSGESGELDAVETWYISEDRRSKVSLSAKEVIEKCRNGALSEDTLVWHEGLDNWTRLSDVPELKLALGALSEQSRPSAEKPRLPPPPSRPPGSRPLGLGFPSLPAPPPGGRVGKKLADAVPAPVVQSEAVLPRFESQATEVYRGNTAEVLKQNVAAVQEPPIASEQQPKLEHKTGVSVAPIENEWPASSGWGKGRSLVLVAAFGVCFAVGAVGFGSAEPPEAAPPIEYDLDEKAGDALGALEARPTAPAVSPSASAPPTSEAAAPAAPDDTPIPSAAAEAAGPVGETDIAKAMREAMAKKAGGGVQGKAQEKSSP